MTRSAKPRVRPHETQPERRLIGTLKERVFYILEHYIHYIMYCELKFESILLYRVQFRDNHTFPALATATQMRPKWQQSDH